MVNLPRMHITSQTRTSSKPPEDGWHMEISRFGVPSIMRVRDGVAFLYADTEAGLKAWAEEAVVGALREAAEVIDKRHRGSLPDHIKSEDGNIIRAMIERRK